MIAIAGCRADYRAVDRLLEAALLPCYDWRLAHLSWFSSPLLLSTPIPPFPHSHIPLFPIPWFCSPVISILYLICQKFGIPIVSAGSRGCCDKLHSIAIMGRSFASLFSSRPAAQGFAGPTDRPLIPNGVPETSWARGGSIKSKSSRPLINLNAPTNNVGSLVVAESCYRGSCRLANY